MPGLILDPAGETSTRLIARLQASDQSLVGKMISYGFIEPAHTIMQDGMFRGLKARVQHGQLMPREPVR